MVKKKEKCVCDMMDESTFINILANKSMAKISLHFEEGRKVLKEEEFYEFQNKSVNEIQEEYVEDE